MSLSTKSKYTIGYKTLKFYSIFFISLYVIFLLVIPQLIRLFPFYLLIVYIVLSEGIDIIRISEDTLTFTPSLKTFRGETSVTLADIDHIYVQKPAYARWTEILFNLKDSKNVSNHFVLLKSERQKLVDTLKKNGYTVYHQDYPL